MFGAAKIASMGLSAAQGVLGGSGAGGVDSKYFEMAKNAALDAGKYALEAALSKLNDKYGKHAQEILDSRGVRGVDVSDFAVLEDIGKALEYADKTYRDDDLNAMRSASVVVELLNENDFGIYDSEDSSRTAWGKKKQISFIIN